jgi:trk system potassium uptake protein TrkA
MKVLIVGGGLVGSTLAEKLSRDGHDVSLVDESAERIRELDETLDVRVVLGNGSMASVLRRAGVEAADLVIATSNSDEVNMVVGLLASECFGVARTVVRLRAADHEESFEKLRRSDRDHVCVNAVEAAVDRIAALLEVRGAVDVVSFLDDRLLVAGFRIHEPSDFVGLRVSDMNLLFADTPALAVAIERGEDWLIPHSEELIEAGDLVYFALAREHMESILALVAVREDLRRDVMIAGATQIGMRLARRLEGRDMRVVLVESDRALALAAAEELPHTTIVHGSVTSQALLEEEEIERVSTFVAVTDEHETNLVARLLAKRLGAGRAVVMVDNPELVRLVSGLNIDAIISPRVLVVGIALQHILGDRVRSVAQLLEDRIEILEAEVREGSALARATLAEVKLPRGVLVAAVARGSQLFVPRGYDSAEPGDRVLLITTSENEPKVARFLEE